MLYAHACCIGWVWIQTLGYIAHIHTHKHAYIHYLRRILTCLYIRCIGLCRRLIDLLGHQDAIICKHALRVIGNLASGAENQKQYLFNTNTFHSLSSLLRSPNEMIIANVCWVLLNVLDASSASSQASSHRNYTSSSASAFASQYVKYILAQHMLAPLLTLNKQIDVSMRSWSGRVLCGMVLVSRPALINTLINQHDLMNVFLDHLVNDPPTPSFTSSSQQQCYYLFVCALLEAINSVLNKHRSHQAHQASSSSSRDRKKFGPSIAHHTYDRANTGSPAGGGGGYGFNDDDDTAVVLSRPLQIRVGQSAEAMCQLRAFYSDRLQQGGKGMQLIRRIVRLIDVLLANHVQQ